MNKQLGTEQQHHHQDVVGRADSNAFSPEKPPDGAVTWRVQTDTVINLSSHQPWAYNSSKVEQAEDVRISTAVKIS